MSKIIGTVLVVVLLLSTVSSCARRAEDASSDLNRNQAGSGAPVTGWTSPTAAAGGVTDYAARDGEAEISVTAAQGALQGVATALPDYAGATTILLGEPITVDGPGAAVTGSTVRITAGGAYRLSGTAVDGQIIVDVRGEEEVHLLLAGVDLTCADSAPIYVLDANAVVITLAEGTENYLGDGTVYTLADPESDEPDAAIYSKTDLTINGSGSLIVEARYRHGITSRDDLTIADATITVDAAGHGIRGRDALVITGATITVNAAEDGLKSNNDKDPEKGFVSIDGGVVQITAGKDGIQAESSVLIRSGDITITSGGGSVDSSQRVAAFGPRARMPVVSDDTESSKGIKARVDLTIEGGTIRVDALDDALHSDGTLTIEGGELTLASGDDAIHADDTIVINGGAIDITRSYEGIEAQVIVINAGHIHIVASDDAINAAGAAGGMPMGGRPGQPGPGAAASSSRLEIHGGYIVVVDAGGDGVDVNGSMLMTGGTLIVNGPTVNMEGALDYDHSFAMTGGFLVAVGSAGMSQAPDASSTQHAVLINLPLTLAAGTMVHIEADDGGVVLTFVPSKPFQSVVLSSPDLERGAEYTVYTGGSSTGTMMDGLYAEGAYTPGTRAGSFTISDTITYVGTSVRGMPGGIRR